MPAGTWTPPTTAACCIALANNPTGASLNGLVGFLVNNGVATFTGLTIGVAASGYTLVATAGSLGAGTSSAFTVTGAAAANLVITTEPPSTLTAAQAS